MKKYDGKKEEVAAALRYDPRENNAPVIVAGGTGREAKLIKELAEKHGIPVYKDENLARTLSRFEAGTEIPEELYRTVAEILVFVAQLDKKYKPAKKSRKEIK